MFMIIRSVSYRAATTVGVLAALACIGTGSAPAAAVPAPGEQSATRAAIAALGTGDTDTAEASFPTGFAAVMHYTPIRESGDAGDRLTNPDGSCSSPVPLPAAFEPACRTHDLGYDLLRYAHATGGELEPDARRALDEGLTRDLHAVCATPGSPPGCTIAADVASIAVQINSWRQHHRAPTPESPLPLLVGVGAVLTVGAALRRAPS